MLASAHQRIGPASQTEVLKAGAIPFVQFTTRDAQGHELKTDASRHDLPI